LLTAWVIACDLHRAAIKRIADSGGELLSTTPNGHQQPRPELSILSRQALIMVRVAAELGFAPSSRSRIALGGTYRTPTEPEDDPADEFFRT
jgi:phage terminase small subunit